MSLEKQKKELYQFIDGDGSFRVKDPDRAGPIYFPLANEAGLLSSLSPNLQGDIKLGQHTFLNIPVSTEDLHLSRQTRNFWLALPSKKGQAPLLWSVAGWSHGQKSPEAGEEKLELEAGILWHQLVRTNKDLGIEARVLNLIPFYGETYEVMMVEIKNVSKKELRFTATSSIPLYGRSADNLRDHRHVSSLLNRLKKEKCGLSLTPTMSFNERGHRANTTTYYVVGVDGDGKPPVGVFPAMESFIGPGGDLEGPEALLKHHTPCKEILPEHQGKEAMGALQFEPCALPPGKSTEFILLLGIQARTNPEKSIDELIYSVDTREKVLKLLADTKKDWEEKLSTIVFKTGDENFNRWIKWVGLQPTLRKIFGCSFLPDFDYGRGGRGWRDLWQDSLALLLADPEAARDDIIGNFGGVRIDGSNATVIGRYPAALPPVTPAQAGVQSGVHVLDSGFRRNDDVRRGDDVRGDDDQRGDDEERGQVASGDLTPFLADRNNLVRTWMDHGVWPFLTTQLYLHQTGDWRLLLEKVPYFRDAQLHRGQRLDYLWLSTVGRAKDIPRENLQLKTKDGRLYEGTVLEHILVQTLAQFFNVGEHNNICLEDADWNDGLDMAAEKGESVAFTALYAGNLEALASLLEICKERIGLNEVSVAEEMILLLDREGKKVNYDSVKEKTQRLKEYFEQTHSGVSGKQASIPVHLLVSDLRGKAGWIKDHLNKNEWIEEGSFAGFNGYYDNDGARLEGPSAGGRVRMTLTGQVFPIMAGVPDAERIAKLVRTVDEFLWDKEVGGIRLNTDFGAVPPPLGRAFSFVYGEKENGAIFSHMVVMYANALYQRGFVKEGFRALNSLYKLAFDSGRSCIYPGLPEYFNNEGRGRYMYLTGSASWYILTLLTQVFGVRGEGGNLVLAPKLIPEQFDEQGEARVDCRFAGSFVTVIYRNIDRLPFDRYAIQRVQVGGKDIPFTRRSAREALLQREIVARPKEWEIVVDLG